jgi:putative ABC transport system ATP-binding protein
MSKYSHIHIRNVGMSYRRGADIVSIFENLTLEIPSGDFVAMMGPSGSGKTTLLNMLGGLVKPQAGEILIGDEEIHRFGERQLTQWRGTTVGFISQFYNLMPILSAAENVELPLLLRNLSRAKRRTNVETALSVVGLGERAKHRPNELSGGQQQRVAIARAIVSDPQIILADEPTGDLDRHAAEEILKLLQTLNRHMGKTIVMVTHDPNAASYANRTLHLDKGVFVERMERAA